MICYNIICYFDQLVDFFYSWILDKSFFVVL